MWGKPTSHKAAAEFRCHVCCLQWSFQLLKRGFKWYKGKGRPAPGTETNVFFKGISIYTPRIVSTGGQTPGATPSTGRLKGHVSGALKSNVDQPVRSELLWGDLSIQDRL